jgi:hypothetical protein
MTRTNILAAFAASIALAGLAGHASAVSPVITVDSVGTAPSWNLPGHYGPTHSEDGDNFQLETVTDPASGAQISVGIRISQRTVGSIVPTGTDYLVQPGYQPGRAPTDPGQTASTSRAWWDFDYYIYDSAGSIGNSGLTVSLTATSMTSGGNFLLTGVPLNSDDNAPTDYLENSEQYKFFSATYNASDIGDYNFTISAFDSATNLTASRTAVATVVPEPASLSLLGASGLLLLRRRRSA